MIPTPKTLRALTTRRFRDAAFGVGTAGALRAFLRQRPEIAAVRGAIAEGALSDREIRDFVGRVLHEFRRGRRLVGDHALSALSVALETVPTGIADEYLMPLSRLRIAELSFAPRVCELVLRERSRSISGLTVSNLRITGSARSVQAMSEWKPQRISTEPHDIPWRANAAA